MHGILSDYKRQRVTISGLSSVILLFYATTCVSCRVSIPTYPRSSIGRLSVIGKMNLLVFEPGELIDTDLLRVEGERAQYMIHVQRVMPGDVLRVGELDGLMGSGVVQTVDRSSVVVKLGQLSRESEPLLVDLILAMPRPQTLKKVLQTGAAMGVRRLSLIRAERVEKSYFSSPLLEEENLKRHLRLGLEQGISTLLPKIRIYTKFGGFVDQELTLLRTEGTHLLLAHPAAGRELCALGLQKTLEEQDRVVLAVGPEGGWQNHEVDMFRRNGFVVFSCGPRVLRVETAVCSLLGQIDLLRKLK